jgi:hypothetical protein
MEGTTDPNSCQQSPTKRDISKWREPGLHSQIVMNPFGIIWVDCKPNPEVSDYTIWLIKSPPPPPPPPPEPFLDSKLDCSSDHRNPMRSRDPKP